MALQELVTYSNVERVSSHTHGLTISLDTSVLEKPYLCKVCNKRFGRSDLLSRHATLHDSQQTSNSTKRRRITSVFRASKACEACAENHLRCDDDKPCRRCNRRGIQCSLDPAHVEEAANTAFRDSTLVDSGGSTPFQQREMSPMIGFGTTMAMNENVESSSALETQPASSNAATLGIEMSSETGDVLPDPYLTLLQPNSENTLPDFYSTKPGGLIDFALETNLDLSIADLSFLESYNTDIPFVNEAAYTALSPVPSVRDADGEASLLDGNVREDRYVERLRWRFVPVSQDHGYSEHGNLLLEGQAGPGDTPQSLRSLPEGSTSMECVDLSLRDKILSIVLGQMPHPLSRAISSFPSPELLDRLILYFLTIPISSARAWFHRPTFNVKQARPEVLLAMAAAGAVLTPDSALRKLGFAMQEVVRHHLPTLYEADNTLISDLELQQAYLLYLEISLWSGNSRKIEIAESFRQPLITMLRRRGMFYTAGYPPINLHPDDTDRITEAKWYSWVRQESTKRLVYHLWEYDMQTSMVLMTKPLISYAEVSIPLPAPSYLWLANDAEQWKRLYLSWQAQCRSLPRVITISDCILNMDLLESHRLLTDMTISCAAVLHALWGMTSEYKQMNMLITRDSRNNNSNLDGNGVVNQPGHWHGGLVMASRYQQLSEMLNYFGISHRDDGAVHWHCIQMHLHMSLEDIQLLAAFLQNPSHPNGILSSIQAWSRSKEGRWAVWHAGQIFRELKILSPQHLRDFTAIALYHSTLTIWAYSIGRGRTVTETGPVIWLDGTETSNLQRFVTLERHQPMLQGLLSEDGPIDLQDPKGTLTLAVQLMRQNHGGQNATEPPLVINLVHLLEKLGEITS
ncbi:hypothetical protein ZTR_03446 [Talaromyces verruculosus]|nr:hypothetical protein ZTR_03446 [Talaromyces verruculosus]